MVFRGESGYLCAWGVSAMLTTRESFDTHNGLFRSNDVEEAGHRFDAETSFSRQLLASGRVAAFYIASLFRDPAVDEGNHETLDQSLHRPNKVRQSFPNCTRRAACRQLPCAI